MSILAGSVFDTSLPGDALDGISRAFFTTLDNNGGGILVTLLATFAVGLGIAAIVWLRREARRERREREALDAEYLAGIAEDPDRVERRTWLRVPVHIKGMVMRTRAERARNEAFETHDIGGGGLAFFSQAPPPKGTPLSLTLDLGERKPFVLRGVVVRVKQGKTPDAPALVALAFRDLGNAAREHLLKWITAEQLRSIARAKGGRLCAFCSRPLADGPEEMHSTCAARLHGNDKQSA